MIGLVPRLLIKYILAVCHALAALPYHGVYFCNPYLKYWMGFVYLLFAAAWLLKPKGRRKFAVAAALSVLTLLSLSEVVVVESHLDVGNELREAG